MEQTVIVRFGHIFSIFTQKKLSNRDGIIDEALRMRIVSYEELTKYKKIKKINAVKQMPESTQKQNIGNAGEYYIASRLSAINFVTTITLGRAEKYDILALNPKGKLFKLSVKTKRLKNITDFPLSKKDEKGQALDFYYVLVKLNEFKEEPDFWIIPSKIVCPLLKKAHDKWKKTLGKKGQPHGNSNLRILPIELRGSQKIYYPAKWEKEVKRYYKNLKQLA